MSGTRMRLVAAAAILGMIGILPAPALAELPASESPVLMRAYYAYGIAEYCGQVSMPVHNGFVLLRFDQLARDNLSPEADRFIRIEARKAVDLEFLNRGLGGQRNWCRTEGRAGVRRFVHYFRERKLIEESQ